MRHLSPHLLNSAVVFTVLAVMNSFRGRSLADREAAYHSGSLLCGLGGDY